jgi:hypothetical protein
MNAAEVLIAVREAGASLRVEGDSLVASNASRIAPAIKVAIRECKPQIIAALRPACRVEIVVLPQAQRYRKVFAHLQLRAPTMVPAGSASSPSGANRPKRSGGRARTYSDCTRSQTSHTPAIAACRDTTARA